MTDLTPSQQALADRFAEHLAMELAGTDADDARRIMNAAQDQAQDALFGSREAWWARDGRIDALRTLVRHTGALVHIWTVNSYAKYGGPVRTPAPLNGGGMKYPACLDAREAEACHKIEEWSRWFASRLYVSGVDARDPFQVLKELDVFGDKDYTLSAKVGLEPVTEDLDGPLRLRIRINTSSDVDVAAAEAYIDVLFGGPNHGPRRIVEKAA
jgi:hypothetical protein